MNKLQNIKLPNGYAHRGLHKLDQSIVENSETALRHALEAGVGIELDVQMSADRVPMVFHDETLSRLTGRDGRLSFMKAHTLQQIHYLTGQDHILTLKDCLEIVKGQAPLLIEVKSHWTESPEMERGILDALEGYEGAFGVMSFDPSIIRRLKSLGFDGLVGLVTSQCPPKDWPQITEDQRLEGKVQFEAARSLEIDFIAHEIGDITNPHLQALLRDRDVALFSWTVRTQAQCRQARSMGATPIFEEIVPDILNEIIEAPSHDVT